MCGIAGWAGAVPADAEVLQRMTGALTHRGPDDAGERIEPGRVALGFRRLSIIDLEGGNQPLANEDETVHATCNGEIYNFRELRRGLESRGHRFRSGSDTEVIVHLYEELGAACVDELQGMFAIALWDARAERLLLLRDRLGVKPLYWAPVEGGIAYASVPGALVAGGLVPRRPDPAAVVESLILQYVPPPRSGFEGINKLAPGERLVFENGTASVDRYWTLDFGKKAPSQDPDEVLTRLDELLRDATRSRLISDVPLGAFLSGGVDSSLVVSYMADAMPQVRTFSIDFDDPRFSEGAHARRVASLYGTEHENYRLEPDAIPLVAEAAHHLGEPFADASAIPTYLLSQVTRRHVTVALSGDGGDEAFAGYRRYLLASGADRVAPVARFLGPRSRAVNGSGLRPGRLADLRRALAALAKPPGERYASLMSHFSPEGLVELCDPSFLESAGSARRAWDEVLALPTGEGVDRYLALDVRTYLPDDLLTKVDRMSMAHSLEVRSPFLDYRVQEFAASLPPGSKLRRFRTKWLLKELARRRGLPDDLVDRRKQGFGVPVGAWFRGELRDWLQDVVLGSTALARNYFRPNVVRRLVDDHLAGRADHTTRLWNLTMLELWHQTWIDRA